MERELLLSSYKFPDKPSSDGYYHIWLPDKSKKSGRRNVKAKTLEELKEKVFQHEKGVNGRGRKTFKEVFDITQKEKLKYTREENMSSTANTLARNDSEYRRFFSGTEFENMYIDDITKRDIETVTAMNLKRHDLRPKGFASYKSILRSVFRLAYEEEWISDNPYERVAFKKYANMIMEPTPVEERAYSQEDLTRMISFLLEKIRANPKYFPAYALLLQILLALRRGEVTALQKSDIHEGYILIRREQLTVNKSRYNERERMDVVEHTKTRKNRKVPVTKEVKTLIGQILNVHEHYGIETDYLFPADNENGVLSNQALYSFYRRMCGKLDIPIRKEVIRGPHSFRRNAITSVTNTTGGDSLMASKMFGNTPEVAENNYYVGLDMDAASEALSAYTASIFPATADENDD